MSSRDDDYGVRSFTSSQFGSDGAASVASLIPHSSSADLASSSSSSSSSPASHHESDSLSDGGNDAASHHGWSDTQELQASQDHGAKPLDDVLSASSPSTHQLEGSDATLRSSIHRSDTLLATVFPHSSHDLSSPAGSTFSRAVSNANLNLESDAEGCYGSNGGGDGGPPSFSSYSRRRDYSVDGNTSGSTSGRSGSGSARGGEGDLVMPSMHLDADDAGAMKRTMRILVHGHSTEERRTLVALFERYNLHLEDQATDLSQSMLSTAPSHSIRSSHHHHHHALRSSPPSFGDYEEILSTNELVSFWSPSSSTATTEQLVKSLLMPREHLERYLSDTYPTSEGLLAHSMDAMDADLAVCFMIFSSQAPSSSEISFAKSISHLIPIVPILVLPPSPKVQKTDALRQAVSDQLDSAHIDWIAPMFLLANHLFERDDDNDMESISARSSLAVSQELLPPPSATFHDARLMGDLDRLQEMITSVGFHDQLRRRRGVSFLEWREVELAARGAIMGTVRSLPVDWNEREVSGRAERDSTRHHLRFSQRVAARRLELFAQSTNLAQPLDSPGLVYAMSSSNDYGGMAESHDAATPRCKPRSLPSSPCSSSSSASPPPLAPTSSHGFFPPSASAVVQQAMLIPVDDPFHLPSLLHLVGLNLRLALLPSSAFLLSSPLAADTGLKHSRAVFFGTVGIIFLVGVAVGGHVRSGLLLLSPSFCR